MFFSLSLLELEMSIKYPKKLLYLIFKLLIPDNFFSNSSSFIIKALASSLNFLTSSSFASNPALIKLPSLESNGRFSPSAASKVSTIF